MKKASKITQKKKSENLINTVFGIFDLESVDWTEAFANCGSKRANPAAIGSELTDFTGAFSACGSVSAKPFAMIIKGIKEPTLAQIRQHVESNDGTYKKLKMYLNGNDAYEVNNVTMTKAEMIERFQRGEL